MDEQIIKTLTEVEQRSKSNTKRLDKLEVQTDSINELAQSVVKMAEAQKNQTEKIQELKDDVKSIDRKVENLESKPGKKWDKAVDYIICAILGLIVGYVFKGIF